MVPAQEFRALLGRELVFGDFVWLELEHIFTQAAKAMMNIVRTSGLTPAEQDSFLCSLASIKIELAALAARSSPNGSADHAKPGRKPRKPNRKAAEGKTAATKGD